MIVKENITDFNLEHIFECGQCFRWEKEADGSYTGIAERKRPVNIAFYPYDKTPDKTQHAGKLVIENAEESDFEDFWRDYLDLDRNYGNIKAKLCKNDEVMKKAIEFGQGIRILKQDEWETLISFIISQNNNIGRIKKCINKLCENFGEFIEEYRGKKYFGIPSANVLASLTEQDLAACGLGYRAKYLIETAKSIEKDNGKMLLQLRKLDTRLAFAYLTNLHGVGPKVANCILLFGLDKFESFPIDVWVKEAMNKLYGIDKEDTNAMAEYAKKKFGEFGGVAQQYLFYYMRSM
jgi:N-glycosylase/DNA lyase